MEKISKFFKTNTTSISLILQAVTGIVLGLIMIFRQSFFFLSVSQIILWYFGLILLFNAVWIVFSLTKGLKSLIYAVVKAVVSFIIVSFIALNLEKIWAFVPLIMSCWSILVGLGGLVSFLQYRNEKSSAPFRFLFSAVINLGFGIPFLLNLAEKLPTSITVLGAYMIVLGISTLLDGIASATPDRFKKKLKKRVRITAPPLMTAFIPIKALNSLNEFFLENDDELPVNLSLQKDFTPPTVEVFIHVSQSLFGSMGHVDIAVGDKVVSFGGYDLEKMKLDGAIGIGVLFEHYKKDEYIAFCQEQSDKTIFGFGLALTPDEVRKIEDKLLEIKSKTYVWKSNLQKAQDDGLSTDNITDYASLLYEKTGAVYYKFKSGSFKYYWVLGTNCVRLADTLLSASGLDTIMSGIITPGTYYDYLNKEFMRPGSRVVKRTAYYHQSTPD